MYSMNKLLSLGFSGSVFCALTVTSYSLQPSFATSPDFTSEEIVTDTVINDGELLDSNIQINGQEYFSTEKIEVQSQLPAPEIDPALEYIENQEPKEIGLTVLINYPDWLSILPDCACTKSEIDRNPKFTRSWLVDRYRRNFGIDYHPGAVYDYRQSASSLREYRSSTEPNAPPIKPGQQCAYDNDGNLINNGPGAGTPDVFAPEGTELFAYRHQRWDVEPFHAFVGDESSEIRENILGLKNYHLIWAPNPGNDGYGNPCPMNPSPPQTGLYEFGSRYIVVASQGNRVCYQGVSIPSQRYAVAVGETTGSLSYSLGVNGGTFIADGWYEHGRTISLSQIGNDLLITHHHTDWSIEYELGVRGESLYDLPYSGGPLIECLNSRRAFFETAPGYEIKPLAQ